MEQRYSDSYGNKDDNEPLTVDIHDRTQYADEKLTLDEKSERSEKRLSRGQKILAGVAITLAIGVGGGIIANMAFQNHSVAAVSSSSAISSSEASSSKADNGIEAYRESMNKYKQMSVDSFESLALDERLLYSQFLIDKTVGSGNYNLSYGAGRTGQDFKIDPTLASIDDNGQEIINDYLYACQISYLQFKGSDQPQKPYNIGDGQKTLRGCNG